MGMRCGSAIAQVSEVRHVTGRQADAYNDKGQNVHFAQLRETLLAISSTTAGNAAYHRASCWGVHRGNHDALLLNHGDTGDVVCGWKNLRREHQRDLRSGHDERLYAPDDPLDGRQTR